MKILLLCLVLIASTGCSRNRTVVNIPTGADGQPIATSNQVQAWETAAGNLHALSTILRSVTDAVVDYNRTGIFPDGQAYVVTLNALGRAGQIGLEAGTFLRNQPNTWGQSTSSQIRIYTRQIGDQLSQAVSSGVLGIKNPDAQVTIRTLIATAQNIVDIITSITQVVEVRRNIDHQEVFLAYARAY